MEFERISDVSAYKVLKLKNKKTCSNALNTEKGCKDNSKTHINETKEHLYQEREKLKQYLVIKTYQ